MNSNNMKAVVH